MLITYGLGALLVGLQIVDAYTTYRAIYEGKAREANPALAWLVAVLPGKWTWLVVVKLFGVLICGVLAILPHTPLTLLALALLCVIYVYVIVNNVRVMRRAGIS